MSKRQRPVEIAKHIAKHNGPDKEGKAHPICKKSKLIDLEEAIKLVELESGISTGLRPYHFNSTRGIWKNQDYVNEVLSKKIDQLLQQKYEGDLTKIVTCTIRDELLSPLIDNFNGREIIVPMGAIGNIFDGSPYKIINHYIKLNRLERDFANLRPYHFKNSPKKTFNEQEIVDELLSKKIDQLLQQKYEGDLTSLIVNTTLEELSEPLIDRLNGKEIEVSTNFLFVRKFNNSTIKAINHYIKIKDIEDDFKYLRPYHFHSAPKKTFNEQEIVDELLSKKIDQLLQQKYEGDLTSLIVNTTLEELSEPLIDRLNGKEIEVSMSATLKKMGNSTYKILKRYYNLKNKPFPYNGGCFSNGEKTSRQRRISGNLNNFDLKKSKYDTSKYGFKQFDGREKDTTREIMAEFYKDKLGKREVAYLGLETEQFSSLQWFARELNYNPQESTIVEMNKRVYNAMIAQQKYGKRKLREILQNLNIVQGDFDKEIDFVNGTYNIVNFDAFGPMSKKKERTLRRIFERHLIENQGVLYITLNDAEVQKRRAKKWGYENQVESLNLLVNRVAEENGYSVKDKFELPYKGGTNGRKHPMILAGYHLESI